MGCLLHKGERVNKRGCSVFDDGKVLWRRTRHDSRLACLQVWERDLKFLKGRVEPGVVL